MPKFIVREGYAYYHPNVKNGFRAGAIVEIPAIDFGDQQWKLEPIPEQAPSTLPPLQDEGTVEVQAPVSTPSPENKQDTVSAPKRRGRPPKSEA